MKLDKFWVVTDPTTPDAELQDIMFETTPRGIFIQFRGGLDAEKDRIEFYTDRKSAEADAMERLEWIQRKPKRSGILSPRKGANGYHDEWYVGITIDGKNDPGWKGYHDDFFKTEPEAKKYAKRVVQDLKQEGKKFKEWSVEVWRAVIDEEDNEVVKMPDQTWGDHYPE